MGEGDQGRQHQGGELGHGLNIGNFERSELRDDPENRTCRGLAKIDANDRSAEKLRLLFHAAKAACGLRQIKVRMSDDRKNANFETNCETDDQT
jgi:hypothetical protein